ncbi:MAG: sensor domain-containing diguanylate cyclase [Nocardioides sp.]|uniref:GGDEF domain-containing protein n=1 Tax=Nocardioides sp. TaxID=35761 RepID=UPI0039E2EB51
MSAPPQHDLDALGHALSAMPDAMVVVDRAGVIRLANAHAGDLFGYAVSELVGSPIEMLVPERVRPFHPELRTGHVPHGYQPLNHENQVTGQHRDGRLLPLEITLSHVETTAGSMRVAAARDVTEKREVEAALREAERRYRQLSEQDPLTGLSNRRRFTEELRVGLEERAGGALVLLDVDGLKQVNDTLGHHAGDLLLSGVGDALAGSVGPDDLAARIGGDEFALLLATSDAGELERCVASVEASIASLPAEPTPTASIGYLLLADLTSAERTLAGALIRADDALYRAKRAGGARSCRG